VGQERAKGREGGKNHLMAIFKANYVKRGKGERGRAKASVRYIQHRRGKDDHIITRTLFGSDGEMTRSDAYRIIDEAKKGSLFYRFILSPDPKTEDRNHDLDMRDIAMQTMQALAERVGESVLWVGAIHADHAPHLHVHLIAVVPKRLYVKDFATLRHRTTEACLEQRRFLDLARTHEREQPYPLPPYPGTDKTFANGLKYSSLGTSRYARKQAIAQKTSAFWHAPRYRSVPPLQTCTCPRCQAVHIHNVRDPVHVCSCGLVLHRQKQLRLTRERPTYRQARKGVGWEL
jgi:hypothetical protein